MRKFCAHKTKKGLLCKAARLAGSDYCFFHDPHTTQARQLGRRIGGQNRHKPPSQTPFPECNVSTPEGLIAFTDTLIHQVWSMGDSVSRVRALVQLSQLQNALLSNRDTGAERSEKYEQYLNDLYELTTGKIAPPFQGTLPGDKPASQPP